MQRQINNCQSFNVCGTFHISQQIGVQNMKRQDQKAATRKKIKDAFVGLLMKKPLDQITVTEIAQTADIDRKTFYLYYETIRDVYMEIERGIVSSLKELLSENDSSDWRDFLVGLTQLMEKDLDFYTVVAHNSDLSFLINDCTEILTSLLRDCLLKGNKNSQEHDIIVKYTAAGIIGVYADWLRADERIPLETLIAVLGSAMNRSLAD